MSNIQKNTRIIAYCILICSLFIPINATATTTFSENFDEGLTFEQLVEQGKWQLGLPWGESFAGTVVISNEQAHSNPNSIKIIGSTTASRDSVISHPIQVNTNVTITFWLYDNISTKHPYSYHYHYH